MKESVQLGKVPSSFKEYMLQGDYQKDKFKFVFPVKFSEIPSTFMIRSKMPKRRDFDKIMKNSISKFHPDFSQGSTSKFTKSHKIKIRSKSKSNSKNKNKSNSKSRSNSKNKSNSRKVSFSTSSKGLQI